ncbi:hypothetical protein QJS10_CPA10g00355 [Acorus calamus]|uniref:BSD2 cysteine rich domain-containing protein n=1 Tax=Acorus calamus TaxID=4465 RepID=A0AAV9DWD6_ACOCL|nr:hypothetical protein QJS10_CPA10g00355 [Acorus calamus]
MASSLCFTASISSPNVPNKTGHPSGARKTGQNLIFIGTHVSKFQAFKIKASTESNDDTKINSILCKDCAGNGAKVCTQCEGSGANSIDHFNGRFKAGAVCWLCRGKREILCGNCNGAGFVGGFMSALEE